MKFTSIAVALLLSSFALAAAPPEKLSLQDLVDRPDRWPDGVTLKKDFALSGGKKLTKGQKLPILEFKGQEVVVDIGKDTAFGLAPADCDLLEAANAAWGKLTPEQRAVEPAMLIDDASLWPEKVKCYSGFTLNNGRDLPPGGEYEVMTITTQGVRLYSPTNASAVMADIGQTDAVARARELAAVAPEKRPSRIANALRKVMVDADGKPHDAGDALDQTKIFALYYGASWCGPCRAFSPGFVKFINEVAAKNPHLTVVLMSNDEKDADMLGYMKAEKMPWPAVSLSNMKKSGVLFGYELGGIPQLVIVDRYGKILSDSYKGPQYVGPKVPMASLQRMLDAGDAK